MFLSLDGPLMLVRALVESYHAVPAAGLFLSRETAELSFTQIGRASSYRFERPRPRPWR